MRQTNIIFGTLILAFVIFITLRGQLSAWLNLFVPKPRAASLGGGSSGGSGSGGIGDIVGTIKGGIDLYNSGSDLFDSSSKLFGNSGGTSSISPGTTFDIPDGETVDI